MSKVCLIYNFAQHYRANIFSLMDKELDIDFYFGDKYLNVKKMDYSMLSHPVKEVRNIKLGPFMWQTGIVSLVFKPYKKYIVLGEPMWLTTWLLLLLGRLFGKEVYFWTHGWYGKESKAKKIIKKVFFGLASGTMTYGNYARNLMIENGLDGDKIMVVHNSLMYDEQILIRKSLCRSSLYQEHFGNNDPVVVFIGRLTTVKKLDMILSAQAICEKQHFYFNSVLIGDGEEKHSLEKIVEVNGLESRVWFYGPCYEESEISQLIYDADLCVAPGNIGLTAMHAMGYGCPCVSHDDFKWQMPEFEAIKENVTGTFFKHDDVEDLARKIKAWFSNHTIDRELVRQSCFYEIDERWNPHVQISVMKKMLGL